MLLAWSLDPLGSDSELPSHVSLLPPKCTFYSSHLAFFTWLPIPSPSALSLLAWDPCSHLHYCNLTFLFQSEWNCVLCPPSLVLAPVPGWYSHDRTLSKGQVIHQHIQAFVFIIQKLPHPPTDKENRVG